MILLLQLQVTILYMCVFHRFFYFFLIKREYLVKWIGRETETSWEHLRCADYIEAVLEVNNGSLDIFFHSLRVHQQSRRCWMCKKSGTTIGCTTCKRRFHNNCTKAPIKLVHWRCDICVKISNSEKINPFR